MSRSSEYDPGDVLMDVIKCTDIQRPVIMVLDPYQTAQRHGIGYRAAKIPDTLSERWQLKFFLVNNFQQSTVLE